MLAWPLILATPHRPHPLPLTISSEGNAQETPKLVTHVTKSELWTHTHPLITTMDSSPHKVVDWLLEFHEKIWNRKDLQHELFHTVTLTIADYEVLQAHLAGLYPDRQEKTYSAQVDGVFCLQNLLCSDPSPRSLALVIPSTSMTRK